jgi:DnaJ-class molecular chaperone
VLSDDKKRSLYDQYGEAGVKSTVGGPSNAYTVLHIIVVSFYNFMLQIINWGRWNTLEAVTSKHVIE